MRQLDYSFCDTYFFQSITRPCTTDEFKCNDAVCNGEEEMICIQTSMYPAF